MKTEAVKAVRLGHPARMSKAAQEYSLEALLKRSGDMTVVEDIKVRAAAQLGMIDYHACTKD